MRIGIDLGGSKIEGVALGPGGAVVACRRVATPRGDYAATVTAVRDLVLALEGETGQAGTVGVGMPGALSRVSGLVKNANSVCLIGRPLDRDLAAALWRPVRVANDADCFALSEAHDGAGAGRAVVFGVIVGTGVGGGVVVDGRLLAGPNAIAGEWGHNPLPWPTAEELPGAPCYCGKRGCIETWLSGPALARLYQADGGVAPPEIDRRAQQGEAWAEAVLSQWEERFARALAGVINLLDPDVVVVGGGLSQLTRLYQNVPRRWGAHVFSDQVATQLLPARHGDASGVRGAAWLWPEEQV